MDALSGVLEESVLFYVLLIDCFVFECFCPECLACLMLSAFELSILLLFDETFEVILAERLFFTLPFGVLG